MDTGDIELDIDRYIQADQAPSTMAQACSSCDESRGCGRDASLPARCVRHERDREELATKRRVRLP
jgi:hypothetical protein